MDTILDKLKGFKKIVYVALCCVFAFLLLCTFILDIDNKAGAITVIVDLVQYLFEGAILAAGLYGLLAGKDAFAKVAFALILGSCPLRLSRPREERRLGLSRQILSGGARRLFRGSQPHAPEGRS